MKIKLLLLIRVNYIASQQILKSIFILFYHVKSLFKFCPTCCRMFCMYASLSTNMFYDFYSSAITSARCQSKNAIAFGLITEMKGNGKAVRDFFQEYQKVIAHNTDFTSLLLSF